MYDLVGRHGACPVRRLALSLTNTHTHTYENSEHYVFTSKLSGNTYIGVANKQFYQVRTGKRSNIAHINKILFNFVIKKRQCRTVRKIQLIFFLFYFEINKKKQNKTQEKENNI